MVFVRRRRCDDASWYWKRRMPRKIGRSSWEMPRLSMQRIPSGEGVVKWRSGGRGDDGWSVTSQVRCVVPGKSEPLLRCCSPHRFDLFALFCIVCLCVCVCVCFFSLCASACECEISNHSELKVGCRTCSLNCWCSALSIQLRPSSRSEFEQTCQCI